MSLLRQCLVLALCLHAGLAAADAQRIVTLSPHLTELVFAAGAGDRLVGVSGFSDYPAEAARLPIVSDRGRINIEAVLRLKPDLVLAWQSGNRPADLEQLERRGLRVVRTEATRFEDVADLLRRIGLLAGTTAVAEAQANDFEQRIAALRARYAARTPVRSFVEIWHTPLMTVNGEHLFSDALRLCGGVNVFEDAPPLTPTVSVEQLHAARIEAILSIAFKEPQRARVAWADRRSLPAVRDGRIYALDADLLSRMTPRLAIGAEQLCAALEQARDSASGQRSARPNR